MKNIIKTIIGLQIILMTTLLLTTALAGPDQAKKGVPFLGYLEGTEGHTLVFDGEGPPIAFIVDGSGSGKGVGPAKLGLFTVTWGGYVDITGDFPHADNLHREFIAANGDTIVFDGTADGTWPDDDGMISVVEELDISSGTGRFAGATGHITLNRSVNGVLATSGSFYGTIVLP